MRGSSEVRLAILAIAAILTGCVAESMDPYEGREQNGGIGKLCTQWVMWEGSAIESDSTGTCANGTAPRLYYTQWLTKSDGCGIAKGDDVVGGIKGIRRVFGCRK